MPPRTFELPGQRAQMFTVDVDSGETELVHESTSLLFEAPNWSSDGQWLVFNGDGRLFRIRPTAGAEAEEIPLGGVPPINNDHVLSPDGSTVYVSADDGHLWAVSLGGGEPRRVSNDRGPDFVYYLHGISPDGRSLAYIGLVRHPDGSATTNVWTIPSGGGEDVQITDDEFPDDGSEFSPDGRWIYFNSERARTAPGHAQLFRTSLDGAVVEQLTHDERVNWFPHPSPDGARVAYISFPSGTLGHPADRDVLLRLREADGTIRDVAALFGGQGTVNVPSWAPDGRRLAYVAYPVEQ